MPHDAHNFGVETLGIVVEVEGVDVLVPLRRILGVRDGAIGARGEPLRMLADPGMVRRGLEGEVKCDLQAECARLSDECREVCLGAQIRMDRVVSARG